tara:strand:+ start:197 stop:490 length:294 start_codon:yes stop_codon:yes gene_type:complete
LANFIYCNFLIYLRVWTNILGLIAAVLVNVAFFPQVMKSWRTKKTEDISLIMYTIYITGIVLWLIYGIVTKDIPIIVSEIMGISLVLSVLYLKIRYG